MTHDEMIAVIAAAKEGKQIQKRLGHDDEDREWHDERNPVWNFACCDYRVKPEPKVIYVNEYADGSMNMTNDRQFALDIAKRGDPVRTAVKYIEAVDQEGSS